MPAMGLNGQRVEQLTGWYHLGHGYRVYNPLLRRFHSPDRLSPFGAGGVNAYVYCLGDPVNYRDPSGTEIELPEWVRGPVLPILVIVLNLGGGVATVGTALVSDVRLSRTSRAAVLAAAVGTPVALGGGIGMLANPDSSNAFLAASAGSLSNGTAGAFRFAVFTRHVVELAKKGELVPRIKAQMRRFVPKFLKSSGKTVVSSPETVNTPLSGKATEAIRFTFPKIGSRPSSPTAQIQRLSNAENFALRRSRRSSTSNESIRSGGSTRL
jgi:RHS repeat-associated protein